MNWFKEHIIEAIGVIIALLTFFGIQPSNIAIKLDFLPVLLYLLAGTLIGWGLSRAYYGIRLKFNNNDDNDRITIEEFSEQFGTTPYELKAFLKTVLDKGAAYRRTDDYLGWKSYLNYLRNFVSTQTIQNGISKYVMKADARKLFMDNPDLLAVVSDDEIKGRAIGGAEGDLPFYLGNSFYWWYYSDEPDAPKPFTVANHVFENQRTR